MITVESRRGIISLYARADDGTPRGAVFMPFCFYEAAANLLTNPALDPFGKIPGVQVLRGEGDARRRAHAALELWRRAGAGCRSSTVIAGPVARKRPVDCGQGLDANDRPYSARSRHRRT